MGQRGPATVKRKLFFLPGHLITLVIGEGREHHRKPGNLPFKANYLFEIEIVQQQMDNGKVHSLVTKQRLWAFCYFIDGFLMGFILRIFVEFFVEFLRKAFGEDF